MTNSYSAFGVNNTSLGYSVQYIVYICPVYCECVVFPSLNVANVSGDRILGQNLDKSPNSFPLDAAHLFHLNAAILGWLLLAVQP